MRIFGDGGSPSERDAQQRRRSRFPGLLHPGGVQEALDRLREAEQRREQRRLDPLPPPPPTTLTPLLVVGVLVSGAFEDVLPLKLTGVVPTPRNVSNVAVRYLRVDDPEHAGRAQVQALVARGFAAFANAGVLRRPNSCEALVSDDLSPADGAPAPEPPYIAYYTTHEATPAAILRLPPSTWGDDSRLKQLRAVLRVDLGSGQLHKFWIELPEPRSIASHRVAVARHVMLVERGLLGSRPVGAIASLPSPTDRTNRLAPPPGGSTNVRRGWVALFELARERKIPRSSAQVIMNEDLADGDHAKMMGIVYVKRAAFIQAAQRRRGS